MPADGYKLCPFCFEEIKEQAIKCKFCRTMLVERDLCCTEFLKSHEDKAREVISRTWQTLAAEEHRKFVLGGVAALAALVVLPLAVKGALSKD